MTHLLVPADPEAPRRARRLRELGLGEAADGALDEFARDLAVAADAPFGMVNFVYADHLFHAGMHVARPGVAPDLLTVPPPAAAPPRVSPREYGWCPHVVVRRLPLVLDDVCDYPRFAGNPVVDEIGIRSYLGAPLIDWTGATLGTICVLDREPRPWGRAGLDFIKARAAGLAELIRDRQPGPAPELMR
jgi:GAF domain-containing protein